MYTQEKGEKTREKELFSFPRNFCSKQFAMSKRKFDVKLRKVGNSYVVTIPKDTIDRFGLKENDYLAIELDTSDINKGEKKNV